MSSPDREERRSPLSLLARELVVVKAQGDEYESEIASLGRKQRRKRAKLGRRVEMARERERQILATLRAGQQGS